MTAAFLPSGLFRWLALLLVLSPLLARAQEGEREQARRKALLEGTHVFRRILHDYKLQPLGDFAAEELQNEPDRCILVVLGDLDKLARVPNGLASFLGRGGALLAASDRALQNPDAVQQLRTVAGVAISPFTLTYAGQEPGPAVCYRSLPYCPFLVPVDGVVPDLFGDRTNRLRVAANVPSKLIPLPGRALPRSIQRLANLPDECVQETGRELQMHLRPSLFAVGGPVGAGRVLVLADHSLFINEMMLPTDNQNVEFTYNCMNWLRGDHAQRSYVLFVEDGVIQTNFDIPLKNLKIPLEEALQMIYARRNELLVEVEKGAARLEDDDTFNRQAMEFLNRMGLPPARLLRQLALWGTLVLLLFGVYRLGIRQRFRHDGSVPLLAPAVGRSLPADPLLEQRTDALIQGGNLWAPASVLVRRWFARLGIEVGEGTPVFTVQGSWWQRRRLRARLRRMRQLADGRQPERVTAPHLWRLQRELDELRAGWERGAWGLSGQETTR